MSSAVISLDPSPVLYAARATRLPGAPC